MEIVSSEDLRSVPVKHRKCRFPEEDEQMEILSEYSEGGCRFECALKQARDKCGGCTPWNYPQTGEINEVIFCLLFD